MNPHEFFFSRNDFYRLGVVTILYGDGKKKVAFGPMRFCIDGDARDGVVCWGINRIMVVIFFVVWLW